LEGLLEGERKLAALERAHIFVLPSYTEGLPNAMIEAMAVGLPVVVTRVGSIPDVVIDETNGLLVQPRDSAALATALRRLIASAELRQRLGQAAHATARTRFATEHAARALSSLIAEIAQHSIVSKSRAGKAKRNPQRNRK
jgi:glycosyltransferase involved in cell wall biosynthesis